MENQEVQEQSKLDQVLDFMVEHPMFVLACAGAGAIAAACKIQERVIRNAIRKANIQTVDYILEKFTTVRF